MKIAVIGSVSRDKIVIKTRGEEYEQVGGGVYYCSHALASLSVEVVAIPILSKQDAALLSELRGKNINIIPQWSKETTSYTNTYPEESLDKCEKENTSKIYNFQLDNNALDSISNCTAVHLVPLSSKELAFSQYSAIRMRHHGLISLDGQGFIVGQLPNLSEFLTGNIDIIKVDEAEALRITNKNTEGSAIKTFFSWGISEVLVTKASNGSFVYCDGKTHSIPAYKPNKIVDATGCGDTYIASYLVKRLGGADCVESANFASKVAAKSLEFKGALRGNFEGDLYHPVSWI